MFVLFARVTLMVTLGASISSGTLGRGRMVVCIVLLGLAAIMT